MAKNKKMKIALRIALFGLAMVALLALGSYLQNQARKAALMAMAKIRGGR